MMSHHPRKPYPSWGRLTWAWFGLLIAGGILFIAIPAIGTYATKPREASVIINLPQEPEKFATIEKTETSSPGIFDVTEVISPDAPPIPPSPQTSAPQSPSTPTLLSQVAPLPDAQGSNTQGPKTITLPSPSQSKTAQSSLDPILENNQISQLATAKVIKLDDLPQSGSAPASPSAIPAAPNPSLYRQTPDGPLPKLSVDGKRSAQYYARPHADSHSRSQAGVNEIGLIVGGLGLNRDVTELAIKRLPPEVSLAFAPYAKNLDEWTEKARQRGHELLLELPMQNTQKGKSHLGSAALLTSQSWPEKKVRLDWLMTRFAGYFAVTNYLGDKFSTDTNAIGPVLKYLDAAGIAYIDDTKVLKGSEFALKSGYGVTDVLIPPNTADFPAYLIKLETVASHNKEAIGKTYATQENIDTIITWAQNIDPAISKIVPVSYLIHQRNQ